MSPIHFRYSKDFFNVRPDISRLVPQKLGNIAPIILWISQLPSKARAQAPAPTPTFPKLDDLDLDLAAEQAQAASKAAADQLAAEQAEATRLAAEQAAATKHKAAAKAREAAQTAAKPQAKAQAPAKAEKPAKTAVARATEFPAGFEPNDACTELAASLGVTLGGVDGELARFEDYHVANGTTFKDWQAGLRNWIRNAAKFAKRDQQQSVAAKPHTRRAPANEDFAGTEYGVRRKL